MVSVTLIEARKVTDKRHGYRGRVNLIDLVHRCGARSLASEKVDLVSASLTCLGKKVLRDSEEEMRSRPQEIGLLSVTLGRNSILTWSHLMIETPIAIAATAAVGFSFA